MNSWSLRQRIEQRLADETGTLRREAPMLCALVYPSPYSVGMSSLGYQAIYARWNGVEGFACERAFLPDDIKEHRDARLPLLTYESARDVGTADVVAFSVAYELELSGVFECLELAGLPLLSSERDARHPLVVMGGPLTFSNPLPLGHFADVVALGEAEAIVNQLSNLVKEIADRALLLEAAARVPGLWVPAIHGEALPPIGRADDELLPARSQITTPNTELANMFLVEPERGCSRGCTYCVMRRSTNGGMRMVSPERVLAAIPEHARKVGLVGAAVSDHPKLPVILRALVDGGREVGISSLRADRLTDEIVGLLAAGGYRAITFASDGASERLRELVERRTRERHLIAATQLAKKHGLGHVKIYQMVGLPEESDADIDELVRFTTELSRIHKIVLGVAPFVAKRNTPLDRSPFAGVKEVDARLDRLRKGLHGAAEVRGTSARWAWVEYQLAQGGMEAGRAALAAWRAGGSFSAWKRAFPEDTSQRRALRVI